MWKTLITVALCLVSASVDAQHQHPFFYQIFADDGLSSDKTTVSIQDYQGFLWVGTEEGLNRIINYEHFDIHKFSRTDTTTLSSDHITALFEDNQQRLWVGTRDGLNLYNRVLNKFQRLSFADDKTTSRVAHIKDITQAPDGSIWLICGNHLLQVDPATLKEKSVHQATAGKGEVLKLNSLEFFDSRLKVGTAAGLFTLANDSLQQSQVFGKEEVTSLFATENSLWVGTAGDGLIRYNAVTGKSLTFRYGMANGLSNNHVNDMVVVDDTALWVATNDGITTVDLASNATAFIQYDFDNAFSLSDKSLRHIYQDRAGNVWITTPNSGINYYHKADNLFGYYGQSQEDGTDRDLMDYAAFALTPSGQGALIGSRKGLSWLENERFRHYPFMGELKQKLTGVFTIEKGKGNTYWLGTNNGIVQWNKSTGRYRSVGAWSLSGYKVNSLFFDNNDMLWVAAENEGLKVLNTYSGELRDIEIESAGGGSAKRFSVNAVLGISGNRVLAATENGLYVVEDDKPEKIDLGSFMGGVQSDIPINALLVDKQNDIWLGTQQDGVLVLNTALEPVYRLDKAVGMKSNDIRAIVEDQQGDFWVTTNAGVTQLKHAGKTSSRLRHFDIQDGLQSDHFSERSALVLSDGSVLLGGLSGLTVFKPEDIADFKVAQNPNIISIAVNGQKWAVGASDTTLNRQAAMLEKLTLKPNQRNITIGFDALDFIRPYDVEYRYKLKGYNNDWTTQKQVNKAVYQKLKGGVNYEFVLQSRGRFSDWSAEKTIAIYIEPHLYETFWFQGVSILMILGLIAAFIWWRNQRNLIKKQALEALVEQRSIDLRKEVNTRKEAERRLTEALAEAERASEVKSQFLANMSHEIRTPLNGILGMTELSLDSDLTDEQRDMLQTIYKSSKSLGSIVNDILDIAKIEAGQMQIVNQKFDVKETMDQVMASFQLEASKKRLTLKHWVLPKVPRLVYGDAGRLRQVLTNLISNALKFTHSGGITVIAEAMNQRATGLELWFTVTDTGIGIPEYQQKNIFESFIQLDSGPSRVYGGTGLGLSISKELVEKMGGEIWVESQEGKGSIFSFYIKVEEYIQNGKPTAKQALSASYQGQLSGKVLLVEDADTNQAVVQKMLAKKGVTTICVPGGKAAMTALKAEKFDLILMDLQMPEIDGYEVTRLIRTSDFEFNKIPIIALTAAAMGGDKEKCMAAGMNDYLVKPVSVQKLTNALSPYISAGEHNPTVEG